MWTDEIIEEVHRITEPELRKAISSRVKMVG